MSALVEYGAPKITYTIQNPSFLSAKIATKR
jgi:hypothetical protein